MVHTSRDYHKPTGNREDAWGSEAEVELRRIIRDRDARIARLEKELAAAKAAALPFLKSGGADEKA